MMATQYKWCTSVSLAIFTIWFWYFKTYGCHFNLIFDLFKDCWQLMATSGKQHQLNICYCFYCLIFEVCMCVRTCCLVSCILCCHFNICINHYIDWNYVFIYVFWSNHKPYIEEEQRTQWPKVKVQKDKQQSTKHTHKTKDQVRQTPLKPGVNSGRYCSWNTMYK
jgi:hypothetical protein